MGKKSKAGKELASHGLILFMIKKRVPLLTITLAALIVSIVVSLLITPRYRSCVILYPATSANMSRSLMGTSSLRDDVMGFGLERDAERLLQVLQSVSIRDRIIEKYDLHEHYGIDPDSRYPLSTLNRKYNNNVRFRKTRYMAIEIEVLDTDPVVAAGMAGDISAFADSVMNGMLKERALQLLAIAEEEYHRLKDEIRQLQDSLAAIGDKGIINYEVQSETLSNAYASAILNHDTAGMEFFRERIRTVSELGGTYTSLYESLILRNERLNDVKSALDEALINAEKVMSHKYVVDEARVADKKAYPVRSLIVAVSTISAFLLTLFMLVLTDAVRRQWPGSR
ncbi:MAG: hypothetical protein R6U58_11800 [Bacteroidales bacterium]